MRHVLLPEKRTGGPRVTNLLRTTRATHNGLKDRSGEKTVATETILYTPRDLVADMEGAQRAIVMSSRQGYW